jgi:hypothetical protein
MVIRTRLISQADRSWEAKGGDLAPVRAWFPPTVRGDIGVEDAQCAPHQADGTIRMAARPTSVHFAQATVEPGQAFAVSVPPGQASQVIGDSG